MWPNSRTTQMVFGNESGVTNYYLPVYPSTGGDSPCMILWFFDSRGGFLYQQLNASGDQIGQPDWVDQSVVDWFKTENADLTSKYGELPSLAFVHIPTNASQALQTEPGVNPNYQPGINDDVSMSIHQCTEHLLTAFCTSIFWRSRRKAGARMVVMTPPASMEAKMFHS